MKNFIVVTLLIAGFVVWPVPASADSCDDIAQGYQSSINAQTLATANELGRRGISSDSPLYQQQMADALQPIEAQMNLQILECKLKMARINAGLTNQQIVSPTPNNSAPNNVYIYVTATATPQPTRSPQVFQNVVPATPTPAPTSMVYHPTYKPALAPKYTPTPIVSPTATPSATSTPTPITKPTQQKFNFF